MPDTRPDPLPATNPDPDTASVGCSVNAPVTLAKVEALCRLARAQRLPDGAELVVRVAGLHGPAVSVVGFAASVPLPDAEVPF